MRITQNVTAFVSLALLSLSGAAHADTLTYTASAPATFVEIKGTLTLPKFNLPGATLDAITLAATSNLSVSGSFTNGDPRTAQVSLSVSADVRVTGLGGLRLDPTPSVSQTLPVAPGPAVSFGPLVSQSTTSANASSSSFGLYTGAGSFDLTYASLTGQSVSSSSGNLGVGVNALADISTTITYQYHTTSSSVPAPGSLVPVVIGAMMGTGGYFRRRK